MLVVIPGDVGLFEVPQAGDDEDEQDGPKLPFICHSESRSFGWPFDPLRGRSLGIIMRLVRDKMLGPLFVDFVHQIADSLRESTISPFATVLFLGIITFSSTF